MLYDDFRTDRQGRRYADVLVMPIFHVALNFFENADRQRRMIESELHHRRPALAGVVWELEREFGIEPYYVILTPKDAIRFRQAVGVLVRLVMQKHGWHPKGTRGSLTGLSDWFKHSERYVANIE